jgi:hypothetical protein
LDRASPVNQVSNAAEQAQCVANTMTGRKPATRQRLGAKLRDALDAMVWDGLPFNEAARKANLSVRAMRLALERPHVAAYLRTQRQVFRASLSTEATFRMRELSRQDENKAAAFSATSKLMSEADQEVNSSTQRHAPGLVVQIINTPAASHDVSVRTQVIDVAAEPLDTPRDD